MTIAKTLEKLAPQIERLEKRYAELQEQHVQLRTKHNDVVVRHARLLELLRRSLPQDDQKENDLEGLIVSLLAFVVRTKIASDKEAAALATRLHED